MSDVHDRALHLLVQPQVGVFLTAEAREMVLRALEEAETLRKDRDSWKRITEATTAKLSELRERFDMIIGLAAIDKPEGSPAPALSEDSPPCAETSPKAGQEAGGVAANDRAEVDDSLTPEQIQRESDDDAAAILAEELKPPGQPFTCAGWNKAANVVCGTKSVHVEIAGKWFCNRHRPDKAEAAAGATP